MIRITKRQREVITLLAKGCTTEQIAAELDLSPRTVRAHLDALRHKLGVRRCRELPAVYRRATGIDLLAERPGEAIPDVP